MTVGTVYGRVGNFSYILEGLKPLKTAFPGYFTNAT